MNEKYLDCTPEYSDFMCFEALDDKKNLTKEEQYIRDKSSYECLVRNKFPDIIFHKVV